MRVAQEAARQMPRTSQIAHAGDGAGGIMAHGANVCDDEAI